jgi:hypothetical protein
MLYGSLVTTAWRVLRLQRVPANILNIQWREAAKGWSSSLDVGSGANNSPQKNKFVPKCHKGPWIWTDSLDNRPKLKKMGMRFGSWNVTSLYRAGSLATVAEEISKYKLDLMGVEVRWDRGGTQPAGEYTG